jgi:hypothetical protein
VGPWEEQWDSLGTDMSKWEEQELHDDDRQARFWRHRPDGIAVKEKEHIIYILRFERVSDAGEGYVAETPREQQCTSTSLERKAFKSCLKTRNGRSTFVTGHKSVSASVRHDLNIKVWHPQGRQTQKL